MALSCLLLLFSISACALCFGRDRVLLSDVQVLTLRRGAFTSARRSDPIPHLRCIGGSAGCPTNTPDVVQCTNRGSDGDDIQWECKASMESTYRFGRIEVSCEGYDYADDPYILQGSCGLEYTLESTGKQSSFGSHDSGGGYGWRNPSPSGGLGLGMSDGVSSLVILLLLAGVVFFIYKMVLAPANSNGGDSVPGMAPGMGPGMAPGMGPGMAPGMGPGMAPGMGPGAPGMGQGYGTGPAHPPSAPSYGFKEEYMRQVPAEATGLVQAMVEVTAPRPGIHIRRSVLPHQLLGLILGLVEQSGVDGNFRHLTTYFTECKIKTIFYKSTCMWATIWLLTYTYYRNVFLWCS
uniref:store-operated calcium entry-associated regulatory factor-like isoform X2 n=1 Tax=Myxine glutinosa TaxID=7769 RepID=UPI00358E6C67